MRYPSSASLVKTSLVPQGGTSARDELRGVSMGVNGTCTLVGYTLGNWSAAPKTGQRLDWMSKVFFSGSGRWY